MMYFKRLSITAVLFLFLLSSSVAVAQKSDAPVDWRAKRKALDRGFADELQDIALWCRSEGIPQQVSQTYALYKPRDLNRQYIFLPSEKGMPKARKGKLGEWLEKISELKKSRPRRSLIWPKKPLMRTLMQSLSSSYMKSSTTIAITRRRGRSSVTRKSKMAGESTRTR